MTSPTRTGETLRIVDGETTVTVRRVYTRMGERLELEAPGVDATNRLDAVALESVTWQDPADLADRATAVESAPVDPPSEDVGAEDPGEPITVANEYAQTRVSKVTDDEAEVGDEAGGGDELGDGDQSGDGDELGDGDQSGDGDEAGDSDQAGIGDEGADVGDDRTERLHVAAPKLGYEIELGAAELEWLATRDHETFTEWLETPYGPEADHEH